MNQEEYANFYREYYKKLRKTHYKGDYTDTRFFAFCKLISGLSGIPQIRLQHVIALIFSELLDQLFDNKFVEIPDIGYLLIEKRLPRKIRHPGTGEIIITKTKGVIRFIPHKRHRARAETSYGKAQAFRWGHRRWIRKHGPKFNLELAPLPAHKAYLDLNPRDYRKYLHRKDVDHVEKQFKNQKLIDKNRMRAIAEKLARKKEQFNRRVRGL